ncbi:Ferritin-2 [Arabidopsis thaliana]
MLLKASPALSLLSSGSTGGGNLFPPSRNSSNRLFSPSGSKFSVQAAKGTNTKSLTGVVFEPFEEVKKELDLVPTTPLFLSLATSSPTMLNLPSTIRSSIVEYNVSYVYHALYAYFDRDNVGLKGFANLEERGHAEMFMEYQNKRGGRVKLQSILMPVSEFDHEEKGDALHAMELALSLEKLTNEKLLKLQSVGVKNNDVQLVDFVESEFLGEQVEAIKKISEYVAQLRRIGKGHGVWHFDQMLLNDEV